MPGGLGAITTSDPPFWKNTPGGGTATVLTVVALLMTEIGVVVAVTFVTAAALGALTLFTTLVKPVLPAVTQVSAEAEDSSAAFRPTTLTVRRRRRLVQPVDKTLRRSPSALAIDRSRITELPPRRSGSATPRRRS